MRQDPVVAERWQRIPDGGGGFVAIVVRCACQWSWGCPYNPAACPCFKLARGMALDDDRALAPPFGPRFDGGGA